MPLAGFLAGTAESHALIQRDIVANDGGLADNNAHAVIDEEAAPNLRARMNFNSSNQPGDLRQRAREKAPVVNPQPVMEAIAPERVQARSKAARPRGRTSPRDRGPEPRRCLRACRRACSHRNLSGGHGQRLHCAVARTECCSGSARRNRGSITTISLPAFSARCATCNAATAAAARRDADQQTFFAGQTARHGQSRRHSIPE